MRELSIGCSGQDVQLIQKGLNEWMHEPRLRAKLSPRGRQMPKLAEDGLFGPKTREAVVEFQSANYLRPDGIVGPKTQFMVYPFVNFSARLVGYGHASGEDAYAAQSAPAGMRLARAAAAGGPLLGQVTTPVAGEGDDEPKNAILGKIDLAPGAKLVLPAIPMLPGDPQWQMTYTITALLLRVSRFELSAEGEFSRLLPVGEASKWRFTGSVTGQYTPGVTSGKWFDGSVYAKLGKQSNVGVGLGLEGCWKPLGKDVLQLCITAEQAASMKPGPGQPEFEASHEISGGIKGSFEFVPLFRW